MLGLVLQVLLEEFAFDIAHFTELMAILWGSLQEAWQIVKDKYKHQSQLATGGTCSFMLILMLPIWEFVSFLSKISLIRVTNYATIKNMVIMHKINNFL